MSYKKDQKEKQRKKQTEGIPAKFTASWKQKRPVLFFVGGFFLLMILFYAFWTSAYFISKINPYIETANASAANVLLNLLGQHTISNGDTISSNAFSIKVSRGCDAIEAMALFAAALLTFPMPWKNKMKGLLIGLLLLVVLNVVRIITLFVTGVYAPRAFDMMHLDVWEGLFIFFAVALWIFFIRQSRRIKINVAV